jgi:hypothetical protein
VAVGRSAAARGGFLERYHLSVNEFASELTNSLSVDTIVCSLTNTEYNSELNDCLSVDRQTEGIFDFPTSKSRTPRGTVLAGGIFQQASRTPRGEGFSNKLPSEA